jgi:ditrans,polycis-polyprenyl diphosphate synthase
MITVFLFSIENFQRSKEEVDYLIDLAVDSFQTLKTTAIAKEWCVNFCGDVSRFPQKIRDLHKEFQHETQSNERYHSMLLL